MKYYAKVNTGAPRIGFIYKGEVLTGKQMETLGEEKLLEMVERGVLGTLGETTPERKLDTESVDVQKPENPAGEQADGGRSAEDEEELPELDNTDGLISDAEEAPEKPAKKTAKRRK